MLGNTVPRTVPGKLMYLEAPTRKQYDQRNLVSFYNTATVPVGWKEVRDAISSHTYTEQLPKASFSKWRDVSSSVLLQSVQDPVLSNILPKQLDNEAACCTQIKVSKWEAYMHA